MAAMPALAQPRRSRGGRRHSTRGELARPDDQAQVGLPPLTIDRMPAGHKKPSMFAEDNLADSKPYALAKPERRGSGAGGGGSGPAGVVTRVWRGQLGGVQKLFRRISETAYMISIPFLLILLFGAAVSNRSIALFGATVVVLLNIGRLVAGAANLAVVPLRDGIDFEKMKKPLRRVIEPVVTIGLVFLAFIFIPWLSAGQAAGGSIADRIRSGAQALEKDMKGQVDQVVDVDNLGTQAQEKLKELGDRAKDLDIQKLGAQAQQKLKELGDKAKDVDVKKLGAQAQEKLKELGSSSKGGTAKADDTGRIRPTVEALEKRTREALDAAKALDELRQQP